MIYLKLFILYSHLGFIFESFVFKISNINKHSGVLIGPYTLVYGLGGIACYFFNSFVNNTFFKYFVFMLCCTLIELTIGHLIKLIYHFDSWDYSYKKMHIGKYICCDYALIWGVMSLIIIKYLNDFFIKVLSFVPNTFFIILTTTIIVDIIITFILCQKKK